MIDIPKEDGFPPQKMSGLPKKDVFSPQKKTSGLPKENVLSPQKMSYLLKEDVLLPQKMSYLPKEDVLLPQKMSSLPKEDILSPQKMNYLPKEDVLSPQKMSSLPKEDVLSPQKMSGLPAKTNINPTLAPAEPLSLNKDKFEAELQAMKHSGLFFFGKPIHKEFLEKTHQLDKDITPIQLNVGDVLVNEAFQGTPNLHAEKQVSVEVREEPVNSLLHNNGNATNEDNLIKGKAIPLKTQDSKIIFDRDRERDLKINEFTAKQEMCITKDLLKQHETEDLSFSNTGAKKGPSHTKAKSLKMKGPQQIQPVSQCTSLQSDLTDNVVERLIPIENTLELNESVTPLKLEVEDEIPNEAVLKPLNLSVKKQYNVQDVMTESIQIPLNLSEKQFPFEICKQPPNLKSKDIDVHTFKKTKEIHTPKNFLEEFETESEEGLFNSIDKKSSTEAEVLLKDPERDSFVSKKENDLNIHESKERQICIPRNSFKEDKMENKIDLVENVTLFNNDEEKPFIEYENSFIENENSLKPYAETSSCINENSHLNIEGVPPKPLNVYKAATIKMRKPLSIPFADKTPKEGKMRLTEEWLENAKISCISTNRLTTIPIKHQPDIGKLDKECVSFTYGSQQTSPVFKTEHDSPMSFGMICGTDSKVNLKGGFVSIEVKKENYGKEIVDQKSAKHEDNNYDIVSQIEKYEENVNVAQNLKPGYEENVNVAQNLKPGYEENVNVLQKVKLGYEENVNVAQNLKPGYEENMNVAQNLKPEYEENVNVAQNLKPGYEENVNVLQKVKLGYEENVNVAQNLKPGYEENMNVAQNLKPEYEENVNVAQNLKPGYEENVNVLQKVKLGYEENVNVAQNLKPGYEENMNVAQNLKPEYEENVNVAQNLKPGYEENVNVLQKVKLGYEENVNVAQNLKPGYEENMNVAQNLKPEYEENVNVAQNLKPGYEENVNVLQKVKLGYEENVNVAQNLKPGYEENMNVAQNLKPEYEENVNVAQNLKPGYEENLNVAQNLKPEYEENVNVLQKVKPGYKANVNASQIVKPKYKENSYASQSNTLKIKTEVLDDFDQQTNISTKIKSEKSETIGMPGIRNYTKVKPKIEVVDRFTDIVKVNKKADAVGDIYLIPNAKPKRIAHQVKSEKQELGDFQNAMDLLLKKEPSRELGRSQGKSQPVTPSIKSNSKISHSSGNTRLSVTKKPSLCALVSNKDEAQVMTSISDEKTNITKNMTFRKRKIMESKSVPPKKPSSSSLFSNKDEAQVMTSISDEQTNFTKNMTSRKRKIVESKSVPPKRIRKKMVEKDSTGPAISVATRKSSAQLDSPEPCVRKAQFPEPVELPELVPVPELPPQSALGSKNRENLYSESLGQSTSKTVALYRPRGHHMSGNQFQSHSSYTFEKYETFAGSPVPYFTENKRPYHSMVQNVMNMGIATSTVITTTPYPYPPKNFFKHPHPCNKHSSESVLFRDDLNEPDDPNLKRFSNKKPKFWHNVKDVTHFLSHTFRNFWRKNFKKKMFSKAYQEEINSMAHQKDEVPEILKQYLDELISLKDAIDMLVPRKFFTESHMISVNIIIEITRRSTEKAELPNYSRDNFRKKSYFEDSLLLLVAGLVRADERFRYLPQQLYDRVQLRLFRLHHTPSGYSVYSLTRFCVQLCLWQAKANNGIHREVWHDYISLFCYDALYCLNYSAIAVIYVTIHLYENILERVKEGKVGGRIKDVEACFLIIAKKNSWGWVYDNIIRKLLNLIDSWMKSEGKIKVEACMVAIRTVSFVCRSFDKKAKHMLEKVFKKIAEVIDAGAPKLDPIDMRCVVESLVVLKRHISPKLFIPTIIKVPECIHVHYTTVSQLYSNMKGTAWEGFSWGGVLATIPASTSVIHGSKTSKKSFNDSQNTSTESLNLPSTSTSSSLVAEPNSEASPISPKRRKTSK
uniref:Uncharacterized protein n=1 Tax=Timema bartmani TaxID=61472 RepID=A0A7R9ESI6_9NEOP|nr:unnamed protein product [Timema bartmani]